jgi:hypothetical protein
VKLKQQTRTTQTTREIQTAEHAGQSENAVKTTNRHPVKKKDTYTTRNGPSVGNAGFFRLNSPKEASRRLHIKR